MSEIKGAILAILIFSAFFFPVLIFLLSHSIHVNGFLKVTTEVGQMVEREGGITERVQQVTERLRKSGYTISFTDTSGKPVTGKQPIGKAIRIRYQLDFRDGFQDERLQTSDIVTVMRR